MGPSNNIDPIATVGFINGFDGLVKINDTWGISALL
jgi:hypothetical protein